MANTHTIDSLFRLKPYLLRYRGAIALGSLSVIATNLIGVLHPWVLKIAIDDLTAGTDRRLLTRYALLLVLISIGEGLFRFLMRRILIGMSRDVEYDLRNDYYAHLQRLSPAFYQRNNTGDILSRGTNDLNAVRMVLGPGIMYSMDTLATMTMTIVLLFSIDWRLTLLTFIPLSLVSFLVKYFGQKIHQRFEQIQEQLSDITTRVQEYLSGIRVVKAYTQEASALTDFDAANQEFLRRNLALIRLQSLLWPMMRAVLGMAFVVLLWYGGAQVVAKRMSLGDFVAFMSYLGMLIWPVIALGWVVNIFQRGAASMSRISRILDEPPEIQDSSELVAVDRLAGDIEIRNLTFAYNGRNVLENISLKVPRGRTLAIVGATGSGKSTLVHLLARLYRVPPGTIFIDGHEIHRLPLGTLRSSIGFVPQDTFLFSEKVSENIAFGAPGAGRPEIEAAARISSVFGDIEDFPNKFDTYVGERGITLSGGQKQRIAISRAVAIDPRILILDDALSSVDTYTEELILGQLTGVMRNRTTILISHRVSTIRNADHIVVLDGGRIAEQGTHNQLLDRDGIYAELHYRQLLREELGMD
ncbi:MAG: ABC transporter ATP-binding protein [Acidobacteriota bacterium]